MFLTLKAFDFKVNVVNDHPSIVISIITRSRDWKNKDFEKEWRLEKNKEFRKYNKIKKHEFVKKDNEYIHDNLLN